MMWRVFCRLPSSRQLSLMLRNVKKLKLLFEGSSFDDGRFVVAERCRSPRFLSVAKLKGEFRVDLRREPPSPDDFPPLVKTSVETEELEEKPAPDSQDVAMDENEGGERATTVSVGASQRLKVQPLPEGVLRVSNEGLGNCLFIAGPCGSLAKAQKNKAKRHEVAQNVRRRNVVRAAKRRNYEVGGHELVELQVDSLKWPAVRSKKPVSFATFLTCTRCRGTRWQLKCPGHRTRPLAAQCPLWGRLSKDQRLALATAWKLSMKFF